MITGNLVVWETRLSIVDWVCSKTQTLLEILKTPKQLRCDLMYLRKSNLCSDVQKANVSVSQSHGVGSYFCGCCFAIGRIPALDLWDFSDCSVTFFKEHSSTSERLLSKRKRSMIKCREVEHAEKFEAQIPITNLKRNGNRDVDELSNVDHVVTNASSSQYEVKTVPPHTLLKRKKIHGMIDDLDNVDFISSNVHSSRKEALLYIFEDNEALMKMIMKSRNPTMRHVSRTHRVALDR